MKKFFPLFPLLALSCLSSYTSAQNITREVFNPATGHAYAVLEPASWTVSEARAVSLGGHLVTVNDGAENSWVWAEFEWETTGNIWIGLNDIANEGTFEWSSGEPFSYQYWHWSEPNDLNGVEDYGCMWGWYGGNWNDFDDAPYGWGDWYGVVEFSTFHLMTPEPLTAGTMGSLTATSAAPGSTIYFEASPWLASIGWEFPGFPGMTIYLQQPLTDLGTAVADATGVATISQLVPPRLSGVTVYAQAFDTANLASTLAVPVVIQ